MDSQLSFEFHRALNKMIQNFLRAFVLIDGVVTAVNDDFTCDITIQGVPYTSVPVKVLTGAQASIYEVPVIGTHCLVTFRDGNRALPQISSFDKVDKLYINCESLVEFNGGKNGGMVLVNDLVTKINNLENLVNNLIEKYNGHTHILTLTSDTGTAAATVSQETGTINPITTANDIQSKVITQ